MCWGGAAGQVEILGLLTAVCAQKDNTYSRNAEQETQIHHVFKTKITSNRKREFVSAKLTPLSL